MGEETMYDDTYEDEATCPYCGDRCSGSFELSDECVIKCDECGQQFHCSREMSITYIGTPDCELNDVEHKYANIAGHPDCVQCVICGIIMVKK